MYKRQEEDGGISFGNYELEAKTKLSDFEYQGDVYKVKTYKEITKLERNDTFVYESVPGTAVTDLKEFEGGMEFTVEGAEDAQITLGMEEDTEYKVIIDGVNAVSYTHLDVYKRQYQAMRVTGAADPTVPAGQTLEGKLPQKTLTRGAARGYSSYGNQVGLATGYVKEIYHPNYVAKRCLLYTSRCV